MVRAQCFHIMQCSPARPCPLRQQLKDRKGRTLTKDDLAHYQKIVIALTETIRLMAEIDAVIGQHGGWPLK